MLIKLTNVSVKFHNKNYNIVVNEHGLMLVSGCNGSGKTTFIKLILGNISNYRGQITRNIKEIAYLPEVAYILRDVMVIDLILIFTKIKKCSFPIDLISDFNLPLFKTTNHLSKGNRQKLLLIISFMGNERLIILDEPFSGLDQNTADVLIKHLKNEKLKRSIIISSHNTAQIKNNADYIYEL